MGPTADAGWSACRYVRCVDMGTTAKFPPQAPGIRLLLRLPKVLIGKSVQHSNPQVMCSFKVAFASVVAEVRCMQLTTWQNAWSRVDILIDWGISNVLSTTITFVGEWGSADSKQNRHSILSRLNTSASSHFARTRRHSSRWLLVFGLLCLRQHQEGVSNHPLQRSCIQIARNTLPWGNN